MRNVWLLLIAVMLICLSAPYESAVPQKMKVSADTMLDAAVKTIGETDCMIDEKGRSVPSVWIDSSISAKEEERTRLHEAVHVSQILHYHGDCAAALSRYNKDPAFHFQMELDAYCSEFLLPDYAPNRRQERIIWIATILHKLHAKDRSVQELIPIVDKRCSEIKYPEEIRDFR